VLAEADLAVGEQRVVELSDLDLLLIRTEDRIHAINNACPHLKLPLRASTVSEDETIVCRWHESAFDLNTGEIIRWCQALTDEGTVRGMEELGNVSKNRAPMIPFPVRVKDGYIWVSVE
jgi:nitrite reductase/ring-hydroxylating ferredoxin subunit